MTGETLVDGRPRRPWWRRKRWAAAGLLWLAVPPLYFAATGPAVYAMNRGWIEPAAVQRFDGPAYRMTRGFPALRWRLTLWQASWSELSARHNASD